MMFPLPLILLLAFQQTAPAVPAAKKPEPPKALIEAAQKGEVEKIRGFSQHPAFGEADGEGRTALLAAGEQGQKAAFREILILMNAQAKQAAVRLPREGQPGVFDLLTAVQARLSAFNAADKKGMTPLMHAARHGWDDLASLLVDGGAKTTPVDTEGRLAADYADNAGYAALAKTLREDLK